jgi:hypothetical protein
MRIEGLQQGPKRTVLLLSCPPTYLQEYVSSWLVGQIRQFRLTSTKAIPYVIPQ